MFDTNYNYVSSITLNGTKYPGGIAIGRDGGVDRFFIADRDMYDYPTIDTPLKEYLLTGGALTHSYNIDLYSNASYLQFALWGVSYDPGLNQVSCVTREYDYIVIQLKKGMFNILIQLINHILDDLMLFLYHNFLVRNGRVIGG